MPRSLRDGFTEEGVAKARMSWLESRKSTFSEDVGYSNFVMGPMRNNTSFEFLIDYDKRIATISVADVNDTFRKYVAMDKMVWSAGVGRN